MTRTLPTHVLAGLATLATSVALTGCPDDAANPPVLWLALDGVETRVRLVPDEPRPY